MGELSSLPFDDETWGPKFKVMKENIEHHVEEEEGEMFPLAEKKLGAERVRELGQQMADMAGAAQRRAA
jgi:hemerythrin-like domain-containing protein